MNWYKIASNVLYLPQKALNQAKDTADWVIDNWRDFILTLEVEKSLLYFIPKPEDVINMWPDPSTSDELRIMEKWIDNKRYKLVRQLKQRVYNEIKNKLPK